MFTKIGNTLINLDKVCYVEYFEEDEQDAALLTLKFSDLEADQVISLEFEGKEATLGYQQIQKQLGIS